MAPRCPPTSRRAPQRDAPTPNAPPDAAVARFAGDLTRIIGPIGDARIGIAVSGGPDSFALLLLAAAAFPGRVEAATVDHRLRAESAAEAAFVADVARSIGVTHATLVLEAIGDGNVSAQARAGRYALLDRWSAERGLSWIATAHHADDQLETMIMRINRGSGVAGLAGVRARHGRIVRPLLGWRRRELVEIVAGCGIAPVDDPTNRDDRYDRARLRKSLATADWLDPIAASRSATALADANEAIDWAVRSVAAERVIESDGVIRFDARDLPPEIRRRLLLFCVSRIDPEAAPRGDSIDRAITALGAGATLTLGDVKCTGGLIWLFSRAAPRRRRD